MTVLARSISSSGVKLACREAAQSSFMEGGGGRAEGGCEDVAMVRRLGRMEG